MERHSLHRMMFYPWSPEPMLLVLWEYGRVRLACVSFKCFGIFVYEPSRCVVFCKKEDQLIQNSGLWVEARPDCDSLNSVHAPQDLCISVSSTGSHNVSAFLSQNTKNLSKKLSFFPSCTYCFLEQDSSCTSWLKASILVNPLVNPWLFSCHDATWSAAYSQRATVITSQS